MQNIECFPVLSWESLNSVDLYLKELDSYVKSYNIQGKWLGKYVYDPELAYNPSLCYKYMMLEKIGKIKSIQNIGLERGSCNLTMNIMPISPIYFGERHESHKLYQKLEICFEKDNDYDEHVIAYRVIDYYRIGKPGIKYLENEEFEMPKMREALILKETITLREILEKKAYKDGIIWFLEYKNRIRFTSLNCNETIAEGILDTKYRTEYVAKVMRDAGKEDYITWLKNNGYETMDNAKRKTMEEKILKLEQELCDLKKEML